MFEELLLYFSDNHGTFFSPHSKIFQLLIRISVCIQSNKPLSNTCFVTQKKTLTRVPKNSYLHRILLFVSLNRSYPLHAKKHLSHIIKARNNSQITTILQNENSAPPRCNFRLRVWWAFKRTNHNKAFPQRLSFV